MIEKFAFNILGLYANKFLDRLERAFQLNSKELIEVYQKKPKPALSVAYMMRQFSYVKKRLNLILMTSKPIIS